MNWTESKIKGVWKIQPSVIEDERGFFARIFCEQQFSERNLCAKWKQNSISFNRQAGTLRGLHKQRQPFEEAKLIRCTQGEIIDIALDMRPNSATFLQWESFKLTAENHDSLYLPEGIAHGFQTLKDNTELTYQISETYHPEAAQRYRWNDPAFKIQWPLPVSCISQQDADAPLWKEQEAAV